MIDKSTLNLAIALDLDYFHIEGLLKVTQLSFPSSDTKEIADVIVSVMSCTLAGEEDIFNQVMALKNKPAITFKEFATLIGDFCNHGLKGRHLTAAVRASITRSVVRANLTTAQKLADRALTVGSVREKYKALIDLSKEKEV